MKNFFRRCADNFGDSDFVPIVSIASAFHPSAARLQLYRAKLILSANRPIPFFGAKHKRVKVPP